MELPLPKEELIAILDEIDEAMDRESDEYGTCGTNLHGYLKIELKARGIEPTYEMLDQIINIDRDE